MSNNQDIQDEGGAWKYFAPMLHIDDDDLDAYQYRLLGHYRRVCGANRGKCTESTKTTATVTKMSTGKVSAVRKQLAELGRINLDIKRAGTTITLRDCWRENILRYSQPSPDEHSVERSPHEQGVHHMNDSVHHMKQRTTVNNQETKDSIASPDGNAAGHVNRMIGLWKDAIDEMVKWPDTPFEHCTEVATDYLFELHGTGAIDDDYDTEQVLAIVKAELIAPPPTTPAPEKPKKERQPNPIFDAVAVGSFGLENVNGDKTAGGRIGKIAAWLKKQPGEITPEMIMSFYGWYDRENNHTARPRDVVKFAEHWLKWQATGQKTAPSTSTNPIPIAPEPLPTLTPEEATEAEKVRSTMGADLRRQWASQGQNHDH